ncbi:MAG: helix-turn-helix transcriptional regulator [Candidatus Rokubacteria bacterium]|nr:helix-turn-helix transcriptional regulator [Candidatus Rokubacteria bacterium]
MDDATTVLPGRLTGADLKRIRLARGLSQGAVAKALGCSVTQVSLMERVPDPLSPRYEVALSRALWGE